MEKYGGIIRSYVYLLGAGFRVGGLVGARAGFRVGAWGGFRVGMRVGFAE